MNSLSVTSRWALRVAALLLVTALATESIAQTSAPTLTAPNAPPRSPPVAKAAPAKATDPCKIYGAGFVNVPGTDTCIKAGGYLRTDAEVNLGR
jgi:hypothetical protein